EETEPEPAPPVAEEPVAAEPEPEPVVAEAEVPEAEPWDAEPALPPALECEAPIGGDPRVPAAELPERACGDPKVPFRTMRRRRTHGRDSRRTEGSLLEEGPLVRRQEGPQACEGRARAQTTESTESAEGPEGQAAEDEPRARFQEREELRRTEDRCVAACSREGFEQWNG